MEGWRVFRVNQGKRMLYPLARVLLLEQHLHHYDNYLLEPAICDGYSFDRSSHEKNVPVETCHCGYYALFDKQQAGALIDDLSFNDDLDHYDEQSKHISLQGGIIAHVRARDKTVVHEYGWRSRHIDVLELYWPRCAYCNSLLALIKYRGDVDWHSVWNSGLACPHSERANEYYILNTLSETKQILLETAARYGAQLTVVERGASFTSIGSRSKSTQSSYLANRMLGNVGL